MIGVAVVQVLFLLFGGTVAADATVCEFSPLDRKESIVAGDGLVAEVWNMPYRSVLLSGPANTDVLLQRYWRRVNDRVNPDPVGLLRRQRGIFERYRQWLEVEKFDRVLSGQVGQIESMTCLESLLLRAHLYAYGDAAHEYEFGAFILGRTGEVRVYFVTNATSSMRYGMVTSYVERDVRDGWTVYTNVHLHPFLFTGRDLSTADFAGTVMPSEADMNSYRQEHGRFNLENAWITNGFHTLRLRSSEFGQL